MCKGAVELWTVTDDSSGLACRAEGATIPPVVALVVCPFRAAAAAEKPLATAPGEVADETEVGLAPVAMSGD